MLQEAVAPHLDELCADCQRRHSENPLRLLDCKQAHCRAITDDLPVLGDSLCSSCGDHFSELQADLAAMEIPFTLQPRIVRGLDYYTRTAFEFVATGLGAQDSIGGGGRYDRLVEEIGGPPTPAVGIGMGLERILLALDAAGAFPTEERREGTLLVALGEEAWLPALSLLQELREAGVVADLDYRRRSLRSQFKFADKEGFRWALILGEEELAAGTVTRRDLVTGEQETLGRDDLRNQLA
jgi:histidyl-tRNA synthetase